MIANEYCSFQPNYKNAHNSPSQSIKKNNKTKNKTATYILSPSMVWIFVFVMIANEYCSFQPNYKNAHNSPSQPIKKTTKPKKNCNIHTKSINGVNLCVCYDCK